MAQRPFVSTHYDACGNLVTTTTTYDNRGNPRTSSYTSGPVRGPIGGGGYYDTTGSNRQPDAVGRWVNGHWVEGGY